MDKNQRHAQEVAQSFLIQLQDLTVTARTKINALTEIAESFRQFAPQISEVIVQHVMKCSSQHLFPALYVVDSIVKFVKMPYIECLEPRLSQIYKAIWEGVPQRREKLDQTVGTWRGYFSDTSLNNIKQLVPCTPVDKAEPVDTRPADTNNNGSQKQLANNICKEALESVTVNSDVKNQQMDISIKQEQQQVEQENLGVKNICGVDSVLNQQPCVFSIPATTIPKVLSLPPAVPTPVQSTPTPIPIIISQPVTTNLLPVQVPMSLPVPPASTQAVPMQTQAVLVQPMQVDTQPPNMHAQSIQMHAYTNALPVNPHPVQVTQQVSIPQPQPLLLPQPVSQVQQPVTMPINNSIVPDSFPVVLKQQQQIQQFESHHMSRKSPFMSQDEFQLMRQQQKQQKQSMQSQQQQQLPFQTQQQQFFPPQFQSIPPLLPPLPPLPPFLPMQQPIFPPPERGEGVVILPPYNMQNNNNQNEGEQWDYESTEFDMKFLKEKHDVPYEILKQKSLETKRAFLDREFQRKHQKRLNPIQSTWWYASQDEWIKATSVGLGVKSAGAQENGVADRNAADQNEVAKVYEVRADDKQTKCALSGDKLVAKWHKQQQDWYYESAVRLYDDLAVKYGVSDGAIVLINCLDESDLQGREFVDNGVSSTTFSSVNDPNFQVGVKRQLDVNGSSTNHIRSVKIKQEVF